MLAVAPNGLKANGGVGCMTDDPELDGASSDAFRGDAWGAILDSSGSPMIRSMSMKSMLTIPLCKALMTSFFAISSSKK